MKDFLIKLGLKETNIGSSTGSEWFANGASIESFTPVDGSLIGAVQTTSKED